MVTLEDSRREIAAQSRAKQVAAIKAIPKIPGRFLFAVGEQMAFYVSAIANIPLALSKYRTEVIRLMAGIAFGTGALAVVGGTVFVVAFLTGFAGIEVGLQGYN